MRCKDSSLRIVLSGNVAIRVDGTVDRVLVCLREKGAVAGNIGDFFWEQKLNTSIYFLSNKSSVSWNAAPLRFIDSLKKRSTGVLRPKDALKNKNIFLDKLK